MRGLLLALAVIVFVSLAGCISPIPITKQTLSLNEYAIFNTSADNSFTGAISHIGVQNENQTVNVAIAITNKGYQATSFGVFPSLLDPVGEEYAGTEILFSDIAPGHTMTLSGNINLPPGAFETLKQNAILHIRFQGTSATPYDVYWAVDFTNLPK